MYTLHWNDSFPFKLTETTELTSHFQLPRSNLNFPENIFTYYKWISWGATISQWAWLPTARRSSAGCGQVGVRGEGAQQEVQDLARDGGARPGHPEGGGGVVCGWGGGVWDAWTGLQFGGGLLSTLMTWISMLMWLFGVILSELFFKFEFALHFLGNIQVLYQYGNFYFNFLAKSHFAVKKSSLIIH